MNTRDKPKRRRGLAGVPLVTLEEWTTGKCDGYGLAAAIVLSGHENKWIRLSTDRQRKTLGYPVFGKCAIHCDGSVFRVNHSSVGGGYTNQYTAGEVTAAAREQRKL